MAGRHGRFVILTDEHVPLALVQALRQTAWTVMRVEDDPGLGKGTDDRIVFAHAAARGWVFLSRDDRALGSLRGRRAPHQAWLLKSR